MRGISNLHLPLRPPQFLSVFGEKDYQQLLLIEKMVEDLNFDIEIIPGTLVREEDGIAMSSRNAYLSSEDREKAKVLYRSLRKGKELFESGERRVSILIKAIRDNMESVNGVLIQYVEIKDAETLVRIENVGKPAVIAITAIVGLTRLIDNIIIGR